MSEDFTDPPFRFERAKQLHGATMALFTSVRACDFRNAIVVRSDGAFVDVGGVLLDVSHTGSYLKSSGKVLANQGEALHRVLCRLGVDVSTMVDVGANFGEIALWFARACPAARVLAVEPSSANLKVLRRNLVAQSFPTGNIEVAQTAIADSSGIVTLTKGAGPMARVVAEPTAGTEQVPCERLDTLSAATASTARTL